MLRQSINLFISDYKFEISLCSFIGLLAIFYLIFYYPQYFLDKVYSLNSWINHFFVVSCANTLFVTTIYLKIYYILTNLQESAYQVDLGDVTTSYCFNLLLVYQDTNLFIILILCLVYYCLFKIIEEHLYNLYGDEITVYPYLYNRFMHYYRSLLDFCYLILEKISKKSHYKILLYFYKFMPINFIHLFNEETLLDSLWTRHMYPIGRFFHSMGYSYLMLVLYFVIGGFPEHENFSYAVTKKLSRKDLDFILANFLNNKFLKLVDVGNYDDSLWLSFGEFAKAYQVPFFKKNMYYSSKIKSSHVLYQFFLLANKKNIYSYELNKYDIYGLDYLQYQICDDTFINFSTNNFRTIRDIALNNYIQEIEILPNNLPLSWGETDVVKNVIDFEKIDNFSQLVSNEEYKSHHINTWLYIYNRSSKYLSSGVPLNNFFSSDRFLKSMSLSSLNTFNFYEVFSIFVDNVFIKHIPTKAFDDSSSYVSLCEPSTVSFLVKVGSFNYCQYSIENGPWYDVILKAHELVHSFAFEYAWALFPSGIICYLMAPAYLLLYSLEFFGQAFLMIKVLGHQWFWSYEIENTMNNSAGGLQFDSNLATNDDYNNRITKRSTFSNLMSLPSAEYWKNTILLPTVINDFLVEATSLYQSLRLYQHHFFSEFLFKTEFWSKLGLPNENFIFKPLRKGIALTDTFSLPRLLATDKRLILPAEKPILLSITSTDVLHAYAVPNFGIKVDAVPGRINTFWLYMNKIGLYYGQCSELCGKGHGFMPIVVDSQPYSNDPLGEKEYAETSSWFESQKNLQYSLSIIDDDVWRGRFVEHFRKFATIWQHERGLMKCVANEKYPAVLCEGKTVEEDESLLKEHKKILSKLKREGKQPITEKTPEWNEYLKKSIETRIKERDLATWALKYGFDTWPSMKHIVYHDLPFQLTVCNGSINAQSCYESEYVQAMKHFQKDIIGRGFSNAIYLQHFMTPLTNGYPLMHWGTLLVNYSSYIMLSGGLNNQIDSLIHMEYIYHPLFPGLEEVADENYIVDNELDRIFLGFKRLNDSMPVLASDMPTCGLFDARPKIEAAGLYNKGIFKGVDQETLDRYQGMAKEQWKEAVQRYDAKYASFDADKKTYFELRKDLLEVIDELKKTEGWDSPNLNDTPLMVAQKKFLVEELDAYWARHDKLFARFFEFAEMDRKQEITHLRHDDPEFWGHFWMLHFIL